MLKRPKDIFISLNLFKGHHARKISGLSHIISKLLNFDIANSEEKVFHLEILFSQVGSASSMELRERSERSISLKHDRADEAVEKKSTFQELHVCSQNALRL